MCLSSVSPWPSILSVLSFTLLHIPYVLAKLARRKPSASVYWIHLTCCLFGLAQATSSRSPAFPESGLLKKILVLFCPPQISSPPSSFSASQNLIPLLSVQLNCNFLKPSLSFPLKFGTFSFAFHGLFWIWLISFNLLCPGFWFLTSPHQTISTYRRVAIFYSLWLHWIACHSPLSIGSIRQKKTVYF